MIRKLNFKRGFTVVELMISITVLLVVMALVTHMIVSTTHNQSRLRMENKMRSSIQSGLFRISSHLTQNRLLMQANTLSYDYLGRVTLTGSPPIIGGTKPTANGTSNVTQLPTIRPDGSLSPEKNCTDFPTNFFRANSVGNMLFFVKYSGKFTRFTTTPTTTRRSLDIYEFKLFYLTNDGGASRSFLDFWSASPTKRPIRLIEWTSQPYIDYDQYLDYIADSTNTQRTTIRSDLTAANLTRVWRRSATDINAAFYSLGTTTNAAVPVDAAHTIPRYRYNDSLLFGKEEYSIAYNSNNTVGASYFPIRHQVPFFYNHNPPSCSGAAADSKYDSQFRNISLSLRV